VLSEKNRRLLPGRTSRCNLHRWHTTRARTPDGSTDISAADDPLAAALTAAARGDQNGFATLWRAHQPAVLRYLRVIAGDQADDIASETWLQAARDLHRFAGDPDAFRGWLYRIARNRAIDHRRRAGRRPEHPTADPGSHLPAAADTATQAIDHTRTEWALRLIAALPPDQAEAVMLRVVAGLDVATTARVLGKRPGAVRVAALRGLRRLAEHPDVRALDDASGWIPGTPHAEGV
jgi:RNA polymerase sigma-70 factor (ECF subfamily)